VSLSLLVLHPLLPPGFFSSLCRLTPGQEGRCSQEACSETYPFLFLFSQDAPFPSFVNPFPPWAVFSCAFTGDYPCLTPPPFNVPFFFGIFQEFFCSFQRQFFSLASTALPDFFLRTVGFETQPANPPPLRTPAPPMTFPRVHPPQSARTDADPLLAPRLCPLLTRILVNHPLV